jgi:hypothetical protein
MCVAIPPLPQYATMVCCSIKKKHRENFTFTLLAILAHTVALGLTSLKRLISLLLTNFLTIFMWFG